MWLPGRCATDGRNTLQARPPTGMAEGAKWAKWADIGQTKEGSNEPCQETLPKRKRANAQNSGCLTDS